MRQEEWHNGSHPKWLLAENLLAKELTVVFNENVHNLHGDVNRAEQQTGDFRLDFFSPRSLSSAFHVNAGHVTWNRSNKSIWWQNVWAENVKRMSSAMCAVQCNAMPDLCPFAKRAFRTTPWGGGSHASVCHTAGTDNKPHRIITLKPNGRRPQIGKLIFYKEDANTPAVPYPTIILKHIVFSMSYSARIKHC